MRRGVELLREQNVLSGSTGSSRLPSPKPKPMRATGPSPRHPRRSAGDVRTDRLSRVRSGTAPGARRNPAQARSRQSRARRRSAPEGHRGRKAARHAQLRAARGAGASQALPIDRPPRRSPRRPRAGARRLCADTGNARDRRGAGAARGAGGDGGGQSWRPRSGSD